MRDFKYILFFLIFVSGFANAQINTAGFSGSSIGGDDDYLNPQKYTIASKHSNYWR